MATGVRAALSVAGTEYLTYRSLRLESLTLRHQIAVLKRSQTRRLRFRPIDRLFLDPNCRRATPRGNPSVFYPRLDRPDIDLDAP